MREKFLIFLILIFYFLFSFTIKSYADVLNPDYYTKKCQSDEIEIECSYTSKVPFGPKTSNECLQYENNVNYRLLTGAGSSFGGTDKYCFKPVSVRSIAPVAFNKFLLQLAVTLIFELPIFLLFGFKTKRELLTVIFANIFSVTLFVISGFIIKLNILNTIVAEVFIIVFECLFIYKLTHHPLKKVIKATIMANIVSAIFGFLALFFFKLINY